MEHNDRQADQSFEDSIKTLMMMMPPDPLTKAAVILAHDHYIATITAIALASDDLPARVVMVNQARETLYDHLDGLADWIPG